ncbi:hypothetical protein A2954_07345 [Candidatus Roizmanbacteria bacterium RIFCSPLOWO2_01_FULL_37_12]|uniref:Uncharacterized protein n=1 Tax=Candidatus Roizmanbacteria bacterium RIFCSPLOWO2_01_FULL_37_12 TaxID=1802056 RepID=A0A1F7IE82_9BACT|nr:MAG: hypothetical protein A2954_07345 [Candidatus Roizmanbacteria bacterium RIFCSPLOWO2_01_FULL_37_12]
MRSKLKSNFFAIPQILEFHNPLIDILHRPHEWCYPICDFVTLPLDFFLIIGSLIVIRRNFIGILGNFVLLSLILWPLAFYLP